MGPCAVIPSELLKILLWSIETVIGDIRDSIAIPALLPAGVFLLAMLFDMENVDGAVLLPL